MQLRAVFPLFGLLLGPMTFQQGVLADVIPPGHKQVSHKMVFVDSPLLRENRLIATPVRGFGGVEEVSANRTFSFSSKYGTRLYVVPKDYEVPKKQTPGQSLPFPSCEPPVGSVTYVSRFSPVASLLTTCKLTEIGDESITVELIEHVELGADGEPASMRKALFPLLAVISVGLAACTLLWRRIRSRAVSSAT